MSFVDQPAAREGRISYINDLFLADEATLVRELADAADPGASGCKKIQATAAQLVSAVRKNSKTDGGIEAFLQQYDLSSAEGVLLMCIAEALLRIPDAGTADKLIADKITSAEWKNHLGASDSLFVNASTWGLMLTGQILTLEETSDEEPPESLPLSSLSSLSWRLRCGWAEGRADGNHPLRQRRAAPLARPRSPEAGKHAVGRDQRHVGVGSGGCRRRGRLADAGDGRDGGNEGRRANRRPWRRTPSS